MSGARRKNGRRTRLPFTFPSPPRHDAQDNGAPKSSPQSHRRARGEPASPPAGSAASPSAGALQSRRVARRPSSDTHRRLPRQARAARDGLRPRPRGSSSRSRARAHPARSAANARKAPPPAVPSGQSLDRASCRPPTRRPRRIFPFRGPLPLSSNRVLPRPRVRNHSFALGASAAST